MPALPSPRLLMGVFAKAENFGVIADTPFGVGYQLHGVAVSVSFFGHHVYFGYQQAVLVLARSDSTNMCVTQTSNTPRRAEASTTRLS